MRDKDLKVESKIRHPLHKARILRGLVPQGKEKTKEKIVSQVEMTKNLV